LEKEKRKEEVGRGPKDRVRISLPREKKEKRGDPRKKKENRRPARRITLEKKDGKPEGGIKKKEEKTRPAGRERILTQKRGRGAPPTKGYRVLREKEKERSSILSRKKREPYKKKKDF